MKLRYFFSLGLSVILVALFFSLKESYYQCEGTFEEETGKTTVNFKLAEYRWWVFLSEGSDGLLALEIPSKRIERGLRKFGQCGKW